MDCSRLSDVNLERQTSFHAADVEERHHLQSEGIERVGDRKTHGNRVVVQLGDSLGDRQQHHQLADPLQHLARVHFRRQSLADDLREGREVLLTGLRDQLGAVLAQPAH